MPPSATQEQAPAEPLTYSLAEAAQLLGISRKTAYNLLNRGVFPVPVLRIGSTWKVSRAVLLAHVNAAGEPGSPDRDASQEASA